MSVTISDLFVQPFGPTGSDGSRTGGIRAYTTNVPSAADWKTLAHNCNYLNSCIATPVPYCTWLSGADITLTYDRPGYFDVNGDAFVLNWQLPIPAKSNITTRQIWRASAGELAYGGAPTLRHTLQLIFDDGQTEHHASGGRGRGGEADGTDSTAAAGSRASRTGRSQGLGQFYVSESVASTNITYLDITSSLTHTQGRFGSTGTSSVDATEMLSLGIQELPRVKFSNPALAHENLVEMRDFWPLGPIVDHNETGPHGVWNGVSASIREGRRGGVFYYLSPRYYRTTTLTGSGTWNLVTSGLTGTLAGGVTPKNFPAAHSFGIPVSARKLDDSVFGQLTVHVDAHGTLNDLFTVDITASKRTGGIISTTQLQGQFTATGVPAWFTQPFSPDADSFTFPQTPESDTNFVKFSYYGDGDFTINSICILEDKDSF